MELSVNGANHTFNSGSTLNALLHELGVTEGRFAVEVNGEIVPKSQHKEFELKNNDNVEIVRAIGGG